MALAFDFRVKTSQNTLAVSDNFCTFVSLKCQHKKTLLLTVQFQEALTKKQMKELKSSMELSSIKDFLEQVNGIMVLPVNGSEMQLIVKLT